jgi:hypothetical protein
MKIILRMAQGGEKATAHKFTGGTVWEIAIAIFI